MGDDPEVAQASASLADQARATGQLREAYTRLGWSIALVTGAWLAVLALVLRRLRPQGAR